MPTLALTAQIEQRLLARNQVLESFLRRIVGKDGSAKIRNSQLWGLLWGPLIQLGASRRISNQSVTSCPSPKLRRSTELHPFNNVTGLCASC
jgi:hypothetical protein